MFINLVYINTINKYPSVEISVFYLVAAAGLIRHITCLFTEPFLVLTSTSILMICQNLGTGGTLTASTMQAPPATNIFPSTVAPAGPMAAPAPWQVCHSIWLFSIGNFAICWILMVWWWCPTVISHSSGLAYF